jgi:acyl carrier protein
MTRDECLAAIAEIMLVNAEELTDSSKLVNFSGWDSVAAIRFMALVHEKCAIIVGGLDLEKATTVGDLIGLMKRKVD